MYINTHIAKEKIGAAATAPKVLKPEQTNINNKRSRKHN